MTVEELQKLILKMRDPLIASMNCGVSTDWYHEVREFIETEIARRDQAQNDYERGFSDGHSKGARQAQKEEPCEHCRRGNAKNMSVGLQSYDSEVKLVEAFIHPSSDTETAAIMITTNYGFGCAGHINIKHCPNCGRRLEGES